MKIRVIHYRKDCIGCNSCVEYSPGNWEISEDDGKSSLLNSKETKQGVFVSEIPESELEENEKAARDCPSRIIKVEKG